jgi:D-arabinitol dehydrogenase (NADP+)
LHAGKQRLNLRGGIMKAVRYERPHAPTIANVPVPEPKPGEVRLRTHTSGVCGTDVHLHAGEFFPRYPLIPGHEVVAEVDAVGDGVTALTTGQLATLNNLITCGVCDNCRRARPPYCRNLRALGVTDPGGFAEYLVAPAGLCHPADDTPAETLVFTEPLACALHGLDTLDPRPGSDVLVLGAGPSGLLLTQLLRNHGATRLTVAARTSFKLDLATAYGADHVVQLHHNASTPWTDQLLKIAPDGFDVVVDATGAPGVQSYGLTLTRDGGTFFVYGMAPDSARLEVSPYEIFRRELTIKGSFAQAFSFDRALLALRTGRVNVTDMITHVFALDSYADAIAAVDTDRQCLKAVIRF